MQRAASRRRRAGDRAATDAADAAAAVDLRVAAARQDFLDALPIGVAVVAICGSELRLETANDPFRHLVEHDERLITFARRLVSALRPRDVLARTSGDEFAILLKLDRGITDALRAAERIRTVLSMPFRLSELEIKVDCAIGCAVVNRRASGAD